jgi:hypothetical protein
LGEPFFATPRADNFASEFVVAFPHDKHGDDVVSASVRRDQFRVINARFNPTQAEPKNCSVCHQTYKPQGKSTEEYVTPRPKNLAEDAFWLHKGAFKTTPSNHTVCFTCHNADSGIEPNPTNCGGCHKLRAAETMQHDYDPKLAAAMGITDRYMLFKWSRRSASKFRHEHDVHGELGCVTCHNPATMNLLNEKSLVSVKSCGGEGSGCHVETNTEGILNFEIDAKQKKPGFQCTKCHIALGKQPIPADHIEALPKPATK